MFVKPGLTDDKLMKLYFEKESEADILGIQLANMACYQILEILNFWINLRQCIVSINEEHPAKDELDYRIPKIEQFLENSIFEGQETCSSTGDEI